MTTLRVIPSMSSASLRVEGDAEMPGMVLREAKVPLTSMMV